ncbi:MAG: DUF45 domain-containing protein [Clostridiales bacterium]|nr:DUF45 domain-containing protein [Clostridiales bacterium]
MIENIRTTSHLGIPYVLTYGKRKRLKITLDTNGRVLAFAPFRLAIKEIERFIDEHADWIEKNRKKILSEILLTPASSADEKKRKAEELKNWASAFLEGYDGRKPNRITIREMSSRWGSCSSSGNISLNLMLCEVSEPLREYVMIHELAHLYQMNHSPLFWNKVAEKCPQYKSCRKELRKYRLPGKN